RVGGHAAERGSHLASGSKHDEAVVPTGQFPADGLARGGQRWSQAFDGGDAPVRVYAHDGPSFTLVLCLHHVCTADCTRSPDGLLSCSARRTSDGSVFSSKYTLPLNESPLKIMKRRQGAATPSTGSA